MRARARERGRLGCVWFENGGRGGGRGVLHDLAPVLFLMRQFGKNSRALRQVCLLGWVVEVHPGSEANKQASKRADAVFSALLDGI